MESSSTSSIVDEPRSSGSESDPLLSPRALPQMRYVRKRLFHVNCQPKQLCLSSNTALLILFWTFVVSVIYAISTEFTGIVSEILTKKLHMHFVHKIERIDLNEKIFLAYSGFALASLFYPFAGFLADVCFGRYKVVIFSLFSLLSAYLFGAVFSIDYLVSGTIVHKNQIEFIIFVILGVIASIASIVGLAGYQANYIQFGLDQLLEAPCEYQGLFVHWAQLFTFLGFTVVEIVFAWYTCQSEGQSRYALASLPLVILSALAILLIITYTQRKSFHTRPVRDNPYKVVFKVLNFARKHKYPVMHNAFTYCDDHEEPNRIDFAKEKYGGPFTTEQVEDVKTFLRMLVVLLAIGPVFVLDIPSNAMFTQMAQHFTFNRKRDAQNCTLTWAIMDTGLLKYFVGVVFLLAYIWLVYSLLRNCIPKIFVRLWTGHFLFVLGGVCMLLIELIGHIVHHERDHKREVCMYYSKVQNSHKMELGMHWSVLILPSVLIGISPLLILTNAFEFISAQSPHSMTGLFIGLFLAIRGFFQFISSIVLYPFFSLDRFWENNHQVLNCGFGYLLFTCVVGVMSLASLTVVAKKYKYRERNVEPYRHVHIQRVSMH